MVLRFQKCLYVHFFAKILVKQVRQNSRPILRVAAAIVFEIGAVFADSFDNFLASIVNWLIWVLHNFDVR